MAKEKSPFEKTAAALKIMGKKIAAKKGPGHALQCVWIKSGSGHAIACDGSVGVVLNLNYWGPLAKVGIIEELAFYADMQAIDYINGYALINADKKEDFVKKFGHGMSVESIVEGKENEPITYPNVEECLPMAENIQHVSKTGAVFYPGRIGVLDTVVEAFGVSFSKPSVAGNLYGERECGTHIAIYPGMLVFANPFKVDQDDISVVPSASEIGKFFKPSKHCQEEINFDATEEKTEN